MGAGRKSTVARTVCVLFAACVASATACADLGGLTGGDDTPTPVTPQPEGGRDNPCQKDLDADHGNCGACNAACGAMEHCLAGKCAPGCPDHVVYVSADGNDNASGCSTATPKRTLGAGLALLKTLKAEKHAIHACRGVYAESVTLDYSASILGGYECSTWQRSASYGYPAFDGINETVVQGTASSPPLVVSTITDTTIDGVTFRALDATATRAAAVVLQGGAKAKFANTKILGGAGSVNMSPASAGLVVDNGSFADVASSIADGGGATNSGTGGYGSAGIFITAKGGGVRVVESRILGGGGIVGGGTGSVGILALGASLASSVDKSAVTGGTGRTGSVGSSSYGIGFFASSSPADVSVTASTITGGSGTCGKACGVSGVSVSTTGKIQILGNRITGGDVKTDLVDDASFTGLRLGDFTTADVQNNAVFSGNTNERFTANAVALDLQRGGTALVANNSLAIGPARALKGSVVVAASKNATFANNLFFDAATDTTDTAVALDACSGRTYALQNNMWIGFPSTTGLLRIARNSGICPADPPPTVHTKLDTLQDDLAAAFGAANAVGNTRLTGTGCSETGCIAVPACTTTTGCLGSVLEGWNAKTAGDVLASGWRLKVGGLCAIARGGTLVAGLATTDAFGSGRSDPRSLGAHEQDGACQ